MAFTPIKITRIHIEITDMESGKITTMTRDGKYNVEIKGGNIFPRHIKFLNEVLDRARECDGE